MLCAVKKKYNEKKKNLSRVQSVQTRNEAKPNENKAYMTRLLLPEGSPYFLTQKNSHIFLFFLFKPILNSKNIDA